jgi:hypothetical protein
MFHFKKDRQLSLNKRILMPKSFPPRRSTVIVFRAGMAMIGPCFQDFSIASRRF